MDNEFYTLLTDRGMAKIASALADKKQLHLQKMAVGDGGGQYYEPSASQAKLRHEVWRGELNTLTVAPSNPNWLIAELVLPENIGGWYVREVGVFDTDGELIAIGKFPESYKPLLPGGSGKQVCIRLIMEVSNTTAVTLTVDPSIVLATRDYVDSQLDKHARSTNHPDATLMQKGFTQLSNATDSDDETKAATSKAVKAAMIEARNHRHTWSQITDIPDGTLTQKGIVKLNNATNSTSTTEAATPSAVKAAMDKANAAAPANHTHTSFYTTNGTFTVPDGVTTLFVEVMGGGGGGAGGAQSSYYEACGGNTGELLVGYLNVEPSQHFSVKVGAGGNGGPFWNNPPVSQVKYSSDNTEKTQKSFDGGDSSFSNMIAKGGHGGYNIYHFNTTQPCIKFIDHPNTYAPGAIRLYAEFYPGKNGENSIYGKGGSAGTVITEYLDNGGSKAIMTHPTPAIGYGSGGAGGSYLPPFEYDNNELTNLGNTSGTKGASGFVKISW